MKRGNLPYTVFHKGKWRFRRGRVWRTLPGNPAENKEANTRYWELLSGRGLVERRNFAALVESYQKSPRWTGLSARSRKDYERVIAYILEKNADTAVPAVKRAAIIAGRDANAHRVRFANYLVQVLSVLFEHAIDLGWRADNPAKGVQRLKMGDGWHQWPEWAIEEFRRRAPEGDLRTIFELALGTGQRIADVLKMRWNDIEGDGINVVQNKTEVELWIPFTDALRAYLQGLPRGVGRIVPLTYSAAHQRLQRLRKGGLEAYTFHGLRANAAAELYERGCTDAEVQSITGHKTAQQARRYGRGASQRRLAMKARRK